MGGIAEDSVRFAHYGPSHNLLRPANSGTRILRAPPPARVRGWTRLHNPFHPPGRILPFHSRIVILPVAFSQFHSRITILPVASPDCILSDPFSHYRPPGYFLLRPSSDTFLPPPASCRYLPSTLPSQHATSHHFALVLFNIHTLFSYMLMQPETLKSQTHFRDNYAVFKTKVCLVYLILGRQDTQTKFN